MTDSVLAGSGLLVAVLITVGWVTFRRRSAPGSRAFLAVIAVLAVIPGTDALVRLDVAPASSIRFVVFLCSTAGGLAWLWFGLSYTGVGPTVTRRRLAGVTGVLSALVVVGIVSEGDAGTLLVVSVRSATLAAGLGSAALLGWYGYRRPGAGPLRWVPLVVGAAVTSLILWLTTVPGMTTADRWMTALGIVATAAGAAVVTLGRGMFTTPGRSALLAREAVVEGLSAAVVVVDRRGRLLDANRTAERWFGFDRIAAFGEPSEGVVGELSAADSNGPTDLLLDTPAGTRPYETMKSPLTGRRGQRIGDTYVLRDVTDRYTAERRQAVLNRILRHNLRNDLDAMRTFAVTDEPAATDRLVETAERLTALGETVDDVDRILSEPATDPTPVDIVSLAESVAATVTATHGGEVTVSGDGPHVRTDRAAVRAVLDELLTNGVKHAATDPTVSVRVRPTADGVSVAIADNGPGLPENERVALTDDVETPLGHATGVGLWSVDCLTARLGGETTVEVTDRGTTVTVRLPSRKRSRTHR